jgi:hypothetical protein
LVFKKRGFFHIFNVMWLDWLGAAILRRNGRVQSCSPAYTNSKNALIAEPSQIRLSSFTPTGVWSCDF